MCKQTTPFVHLIQTPVGYYCFDVNRHKVIDLNKEDYLYLKKWLDSGDVPTKEPPVKISNLLELGFLSSNRVLEVSYGGELLANILLSRAMRKITLQVTQDCNFRCEYCIYSGKPELGQRSHAKKKMDFTTATSAIDYLYDHSIDSTDVNIGFYGGEPLLEFPLIEKIVSYAEKKFAGKALSFNLTTNGSLLTPKVAEFFVKHNVMVLLSFDGPKEIHDKNRVFAQSGQGTYDIIRTKLLSIISQVPEFREKVSINMVIDPQNDFEAISNFDPSVLGLSQTSISSSLVERGDLTKITQTTEERNREIEYGWRARYHDFKLILSHLDIYRNMSISPIFYKFKEALNKREHSFEEMLPLSPISAPAGPCIPGHNRLFVTVNGDFFPCERVSETSQAMQIGSLADGIDWKKVSTLLNIGKLTSSKCKNCWAFRLCSLCPKHADGGTILSGAKKEIYCADSKYNAEMAIKEQILYNVLPTKYGEAMKRHYDNQKNSSISCST